MNLPLLQPQKIEGVSARVSAMLNALAAQRNQTADEVANLCGELAEAREEIAKLKTCIEEFKKERGDGDNVIHDHAR